MAIGFTATNIATQVVPDRALTATNSPSVRVAQFGDGYQQRAPIGINNLVQDYSLSFSNRSKIEADDIAAFFESKKGVTAFNFTIPDTNSTSVTKGTTAASHDTSNSLILTLKAPNPDISTGSLVTGVGISGAPTVSAVSGNSVTINTVQNVNTNILLTFTNPNERTFKVICGDWDISYGNQNFYSISTTFKRVYEP